MKISAVIITLNEERNISNAIESLGFADEILVIDANSIDRTVEIAGSLGAKIIARDWSGFSDQKQFGVDEAAHDWIFSIDADERVSEKLNEEIESIKRAEPGADGYRISRLSTYMGRTIRHSGWYPNRQLRLFNRRKGRWNGREIHESVEMDGGSVIKALQHDILHFSIENAAHHHQMIGERYAPLAAMQLLRSGHKTSQLRVAIAGPLAFLRSYILRLGFLDGFPGLCIASFAAYHAYLKQVMLWELEMREDDRS